MDKKEDTTSFVIRFTQKMYQDESGETQIQWRGNIRHVQGGDEKRFSDFAKAMDFIQDKLAELTIQAMENKPEEEQKGILEKSFDLLNKVATGGPKMVIQTLKESRDQVDQIQSQIKETIQHNIEEGIDQWRGPSKSDFKDMMKAITSIAGDLEELKSKVDGLSEKGA